MSENTNSLTGFMRKHNIQWIYILMIVYIIFVAFYNPSFMTFSNWMNIIKQVAVYGILSCGITFVMLTGRTDLSAGYMLTFLASISCYFITTGIENQFIAIALPLVMGAVLGLINGILVGVLRLNSFVITLGMASVYRAMVLLFVKKYGSMEGNLNMNVYKFFGQGYVCGIPMQAIIFILVAIIGAFVLKRTVFGQKVYMVGANANCANFSGINPSKIIVVTFVIAGVLTGLAAIIMSSRIMSAQPKMGYGYEFTALTAIVLGGLRIQGGKGKMSGTVLGVLLLGIIDNSFVIMGIDSNLQHMAKGAILLAAVATQIIEERRSSI